VVGREGVGGIELDWTSSQVVVNGKGCRRGSCRHDELGTKSLAEKRLRRKTPPLVKHDPCEG
jgi:hypothetical protein